MKTILISGVSTSHSTTTTFHVQSLKGAKIFFCFPIFSIFGSLASETCIISCYYTPDRRTFFKSLRGAQKSRGIYIYIYVQRNPAIAHFKGPTDFMPYCGNALLPYNYILKCIVIKSIVNK